MPHDPILLLRVVVEEVAGAVAVLAASVAVAGVVVVVVVIVAVVVKERIRYKTNTESQAFESFSLVKPRGTGLLAEVCQPAIFVAAMCGLQYLKEMLWRKLLEDASSFEES